MPGLPRHGGEPGLQVLRLQRRHEPRVVLRLRAFQAEVVGPGHLLQLERAALADAVGVGVREAAAIQHHGLKARRVQAGQRALGMGGVAEPHGADAAVAPGLGHEPSAGVEAVVPLVQVFDELALGIVAAAAVLEDHHIARPHIDGGHLGAGLGTGLGDVAEAGDVPPVGRALHDRRETAGHGLPAARGTIDVGGELHPVAHGDADIALQQDLIGAVGRVGGAGGGGREG